MSDAGTRGQGDMGTARPKTFLDKCGPTGEHDWVRNDNRQEGGIKCSRCGAVFTAEDAHHAETGE